MRIAYLFILMTSVTVFAQTPPTPPRSSICGSLIGFLKRDRVDRSVPTTTELSKQIAAGTSVEPAEIEAFINGAADSFNERISTAPLGLPKVQSETTQDSVPPQSQGDIDGDQLVDSPIEALSTPKLSGEESARPSTATFQITESIVRRMLEHPRFRKRYNYDRLFAANLSVLNDLIEDAIHTRYGPDARLTWKDVTFGSVPADDPRVALAIELQMAVIKPAIGVLDLPLVLRLDQGTPAAEDAAKIDLESSPRLQIAIEDEIFKSHGELAETLWKAFFHNTLPIEDIRFGIAKLFQMQALEAVVRKQGKALPDLLGEDADAPPVDLIESLVKYADDSLEIGFGKNPFVKTKTRQQYTDDSLAKLPQGKLDLLILVEHPDFAVGRTNVQMLAPLRLAMASLTPGGRLIVVHRDTSGATRFKKLERTADALEFEKNPINLILRGASGLIITNLPAGN